MRAPWPLLVSGILFGCGASHSAADDAGADAASVTGCSASSTTDVDLLFVIEGGGYVVESQLALAGPLPGFLGALTSGDLDGDGVPEQPGVERLHVGVVTSDMGALGNTLPTCSTLLGDDGILRAEVAPFAPAPPGGPLPPVHRIAPGDDLEVAAERIGAVLQTGNDYGCGLEQPLEAALKALSPAAPTEWTAPGYAPPTFWMGEGHGDGENAGSIREDSVLAIVVLSSEEDVSAEDPAFFDPASPGDLQTRYITHPEGLHPIERYVEGLGGLREDPARLVLGLVIGLPSEEAPDEVDLDSLLDDPRMAYGVDGFRPLPVCGSGSPVPAAFPARRLVEVARGLERRGGEAVASSICQADQGPLYDALARAIGRALDGRPCE